MKYYRTSKGKFWHIVKETGTTACCVQRVGAGEIIDNPGDKIICKWCVKQHYKDLFVLTFECLECGKTFVRKTYSRKLTCSEKCKNKRVKRLAQRNNTDGPSLWSDKANKPHRIAAFRKFQKERKCTGKTECQNYDTCLDNFIMKNRICCIKYQTRRVI